MVGRAAWRAASAIAMVATLSVTACSNPQAAGDRLVRELPELYPQQVVAVAFENTPPLDPPTLFIDLSPSMSPDEQLRFLCDELVPRIKATGTSIPATVSYGWWSDDCE
jgi:hypothetical protein